MAKSLQTRCKAIRNAVNVYNSLAVKMEPPRPTLDWTKVTHYSFLDEFNLLRDTRNDIRDKPWARPEVRVVMKQARRVARAQEEIVRLNVEVRRVQTSIHDEARLFTNILVGLKERDDPLYGPVHDLCLRRQRVNMRVLARLHQIHALVGFTGNASVGKRNSCDQVGDVRQESEAAHTAVGSEVAELEREDCDDLDGHDLADDDDNSGDIGGIVDYMMNLAVL